MTARLKFIAVTHDILGDVFWEVFRRGLFDAAQRYGVEVEHLRPGRFSPEIQATLIGARAARVAPAVLADPGQQPVLGLQHDVEPGDEAVLELVAVG